ncbi:nuclear exosome regulator NRDE2-like [Oratosquilla oratoria]|uniref:nuclear exosome regulator NRDE2-like n=1 Tax=Oratosquilla oratoria TaxID=337810 RepID=UPI003F75F9E3
MSLFPAYTEKANDLKVSDADTPSWLRNESCPPEIGQASAVANKDSPLHIDTEVSNSNRLNDSSVDTSSIALEDIPLPSDLQNVTSQENISMSENKKEKKKKKKNKLRSGSRSPDRRKSDSSHSSSKKKKSRRCEESSDHHTSRTKSPSRSSSKKKKKRKRSSRSYSRSRSPSHEKQKEPLSKKAELSELMQKLVAGNKSVFLQDMGPGIRPEDTIHIDRKGDQENLAFKTTIYTKLARYTPCKGVMGRKKKKTVKQGIRYFSKVGVQRMNEGSNFCFNKMTDNVKLQGDNSYIPLSFTYSEEKQIIRNIKDSEDANPLNIYDTKTELYIRGIGEDGTPFSREQDNIEVEHNYWKNKAKEYNEQLGKKPNNVSLWLEFVKFQDKAFVHLFDNEQSTTKNAKNKMQARQKALLERKLSILETAIRKNMRNLQLYLERLRIGQDVWDDKKLKQEWNTFVFNFPSELSAWYSYLTFMQTHFSTFNLNFVTNSFGRCIEKMREMKEGSFITHKVPMNIGYHLVDVANQLACLWQQGGYMERAVALFQALIELNLFVPKTFKGFKVSLESKLALFEPFWDSRSPRVGEKDAKGWSSVMEKREQVIFPEVILGGAYDEEDVILERKGTSTEMWLMLEKCREKRHWLPWEQDPDECEDPDRMVSFETISPYLFTLTSDEETYYLVIKFLKFLGVGVPVEGETQVKLKDKMSVHDQKYGNESHKAEELFYPVRLETLGNEEVLGKLGDLQADGINCNIFNFPSVGPSIREYNGEQLFWFALSVIEQVEMVLKSEYKAKLIIIYIRLIKMRLEVLKKFMPKDKLKSTQKTLKKKVKRLVAKDELKEDLEVYLHYAKLEEALGNTEESAKLYMMTLHGQSVDTENPNFPILLKLYTSLVQVFFRHIEENRTGKEQLLSALCSLSIEGKFLPSSEYSTPANILRARNKYQEISSNMLNLICTPIPEEKIASLDIKKDVLVMYTAFLSHIQLLTLGTKPACLVFEVVIEMLKKTIKKELYEQKKRHSGKGTFNPKQTEIMQTVLEFLYEEYLGTVVISQRITFLLNDQRQNFAPVTMRSLIREALEVSPRNTYFLQLQSQYQNWRDLLGGLGLKQDGKRPSIIQLVYMVLPHIKRTVKLFSETEEGNMGSGYQLEAVLEEAVREWPGAHCPLLWRLYLALIAGTRPRALSSVMYRAMHHCPGVKSVYMDCVHHNAKVLREVVTLLGEKGIRVRLPLEELVVLTEKELEEDDMNTQEDKESEDEFSE